MNYSTDPIVQTLCEFFSDAERVKSAMAKMAKESSFSELWHALGPLLTLPRNPPPRSVVCSPAEWNRVLDVAKREYLRGLVLIWERDNKGPLFPERE